MKINNLSYQLRSGAPFFFKDVSFQLERGKLHALHGKNGSGKTVLLNLLGNKKPFGTILTGEISGGGAVCLVNQKFDEMICDTFTFYENLQFAKLGHYPKLFSTLKTPLIEFSQKIRIDPAQPAHTLSGGQRQILALLMVLQKPHNTLLLDEPTAALDEEGAKMVFDFLQTAAKERDLSILAVCHDRELIEAHATGRHLHLTVQPNGLRVFT